MIRRVALISLAGPLLVPVGLAPGRPPSETDLAQAKGYGGSVR